MIRALHLYSGHTVAFGLPLNKTNTAARSAKPLNHWGPPSGVFFASLLATVLFSQAARALLLEILATTAKFKIYRKIPQNWSKIEAIRLAGL
jgi:hypothetical protein